MASPRLDAATVIVAPLVPAATVARPRLGDVLDRIAPGGVGLVVAPAGSGKSVLLGQWMHRSAVDGCHLQVTPAHDDPVVFARDLTSALASVAPEFDPQVANSVAASGSSLGAVFVSKLLGSLEALGREVVLVLDDLHRLTNRAICGDLDHVVERLPDNVRLVLSARWDPQVRLQSSRLRNRLVEIRARDLAFDPEEGRQLIEAVSGRSLSTGQSDALVARTDGWAAGLQLASISLQGVTDIDAFIDVFTGTNKVVADYLAEEVVDDLEPDVRRFLCHTSVLEWLDADVCNAVTGDSDAEAMLDLLARRSLLVVPAQGSGGRLRYHHLFADLLRYRLRATEPAEEPRLRRRAASFLLGQGQLADGIEQLLAAGDGAAVVRVIVERGQGFFEREESLTLVRWLTRARAQCADVPVALDINLLAAQLAGHDTSGAVETYRRLRRRDDLEIGQTAAAAALFSCLGLNDLPSGEVHRAADEAIGLLGTCDVVTDFLGIGGRDTAAFLATAMKALAWLHDGELLESVATFEAALRLPAGQYRLWRVFALGGQALALALAGHSTDARAHASTALALAEANGIAHHHGLAYAHFALARVSLDQRDTAATAFHLHEAGLRVQRSGRAALRSLHQLLRIEHLAMTSGPCAALTELRSSSPVTFEPPLFVELHRAQLLHLLVGSDLAGQARALLEASRPTPWLLPALIECELGSGDVAAARRALDQSAPRPELRATVERLLAAVAVLDAEGQTEQADRALRDALDRAEPELLRQPFLEQPAALQVLHRRPRQGSHAFVHSMLEARAGEARRDAQDRLVEPLTARECEILDYLPTRLSNIEIAAELYVSVNTLKSHLRHIYTKLAATNRDEAVTHATDLGFF